MNALDIALAVVLSYFLLRGIFRGLVKEVVGILGLFIAFWVASSYWQMGALQLTPITEKESYRGVLSFVIIFLVVYFLAGLLSIFVDKIVKLTLTPLVSSAFGGILGLLKGIAISVILLTAVTAFLFTSDSFFNNSVAWTYIYPMTEEVKAWLPEKLDTFIAERQGEVRGSLTPQASTQTAQTQGAPLGLAPPTDYPSLMAIVRAHPMEVNATWLELLESTNNESLDQDTIRRFVRDHPHLFSAPRPQERLWPEPDTPE
ncbi:MAG: CvpA family protein [Deltaproteobacteria bacterium]|jgi:membrane protein required for colicin V production|nr:CvpA family protein [Deltaproteobacteria bacterium]